MEAVLKLITLSTIGFLLCFSVTLQAQDRVFTECLQSLQEKAREQKSADWIVDQVVPGLVYQQQVIKYDRAQPEFTQTFADYFKKRVTQWRIDQAKKHYAENKAFLDQLTLRYGIPGQYLIAFWGMETNFGSYLGKMPILDSLATLACDERRSEFFTRELLTALRVLEREKLQASDMKGSWAGAMGHTQFMPSAYEAYAVDGDGDGRINLWNSNKDALASAANFLQNLGWETTVRWGREVLLPQSFPYVKTGLGEQKKLSEWRDIGVTRIDGQRLPKLDIGASILVPMGHTGPAFVVYNNYRVIMRWNNSESYAIAVGHLSDRIIGNTGLSRSVDTDTPPLNPDLIVHLQQQLTSEGFDTGEADGIIGPDTRTALRNYQVSRQLVSDGFPGFSTFVALGIELPVVVK